MGTTQSSEFEPPVIDAAKPYKVPEADKEFLLKDTTLPPYFLDAMFKLFEDCCDGGGNLNKEKFVKMFQGRMKLSDELKEFLLSLYTAFDENGDLVLDVKEFIQMLQILLCGDKMERLNGIFRMCDKDGNGVITQEELRSTMQCLAPLNKGGLTEEQRRDHLLLVADDIFQKFDIDHDGVITSVEFHKGAAQHPELLKEIEEVIKVCIGQGF